MFRPYGSDDIRIVSDASRFDFQNNFPKLRGSRNSTPTNSDIYEKDTTSSKVTLDTIIPLYSSKINEGQQNRRYQPLQNYISDESSIHIPKQRQQNKVRFSVGIQVPQDTINSQPPSLPPKDEIPIRTKSQKEFLPYPESIIDNQNDLPPLPTPQEKLGSLQHKELPFEEDNSSVLSRQQHLEHDLVKRVMNRPLISIKADRFGEQFHNRKLTITINFLLYLFEMLVSIIIIVLSSVLIKIDNEIDDGYYRYFIADGIISLIISLLFMFQIINYEKRNGSFYCLAATIMKFVSFIIIIAVIFPDSSHISNKIWSIRRCIGAFIIISTFLWLSNLIMFITTLYISRLNLLEDINFDFAEQGAVEKPEKYPTQKHYNDLPPERTPLKEYYLNEHGEMYALNNEMEKSQHKHKNKILLVYLLLYLSIGYSLLLPHDWTSIVKPSLYSIKETKQKLLINLQSLFSNITEEFQNYSYNKNDTLYFLPKELINPTILSSIGDQWLNLSNTEHILLPKDFKTFFLFNGTDEDSQPFNIFKNNKSFDINKFLINSVPFSIPDLIQLHDYFLVLPSAYFKNVSIYQNSLIHLPKSQLPLFRNQLSENKPMMVFMFNQTKKELIKNNPIIHIKNYLKQETAPVSNFFDKFANIWLNQLNYDSLVHAIYCNLHYKDSPYCVKISSSNIDIFPIYKYQKMNKREETVDIEEAKDDEKGIEEVEASDSDEVESQAIRQLHDAIVDKKKGMIDFKKSLFYEPKETIEEIDEAIDHKIDVGKTKFVNTKDALIGKLDDKKTSVKSVLEHKADFIDDKTDAVADKLIRTKHKISALKFDPRIFDKSKLEKLEEEYDEKYKYIDDIFDDKLHYDNLNIDEKEDFEELPKYSNDNSYISKRNEEELPKYNNVNSYIEKMNEAPVPKNEGFYSFPISLLNFSQIDNPPRKTTYSQVINLQETKKKIMKRSIQFSDDDDCKPITWYNLFHYSIFGEPKFCKDQS
ncbi:unnamed protein product [Candida verbasci]|uniref:Uncharacterized protein n=1 Tax=Candida verbasci TaxID=1227364 RepID=A0A9W4X859_9ASCO|nr:unnamed protein product [Candida verbasci]